MICYIAKNSAQNKKHQHLLVLFGDDQLEKMQGQTDAFSALRTSFSLSRKHTHFTVDLGSGCGDT